MMLAKGVERRCTPMPRRWPPINPVRVLFAQAANVRWIHGFTTLFASIRLHRRQSAWHRRQSAFPGFWLECLSPTDIPLSGGVANNGGVHAARAFWKDDEDHRRKTAKRRRMVR